MRLDRLRALPLAAAALAGCSRCDRSAALNPYAAAPRSPVAPWSPPASQVEAPPPVPSTAPQPPGGLHDLPELIDLALQNNPDTRRLWQEARAAAARLGKSEGAYLPKGTLQTIGGTSRAARAMPAGKEVIIGPAIVPRR